MTYTNQKLEEFQMSMVNDNCQLIFFLSASTIRKVILWELVENNENIFTGRRKKFVAQKCVLTTKFNCNDFFERFFWATLY